MALRLRGATSGYTELKAPASAGDNTLTLPTNNGSSNQLLKTDGNGNLSWTDDNSGVSLSGSTNNTIATVTGANALQGEANLTFDGTTLIASTDIKVQGGSGDTTFILHRTNAAGSNDNSFGNVRFTDNNNNEVAGIRGCRHSAVDDAYLQFLTRSTGGSITERFRLSPTNDIATFSGSNSGSLTFRNDTSNEMQIHSGGSDALIFGTGGENERLRITSSGALLVGTATPYYGSGDMQHEIRKDNNRTYTAPLMSSHSHLFLNNSDTTTNAFCGLGVRAGSGDGSLGFVYTGSANAADFVINTDGGSNGVERLRIANAGNVGIGTTAPSSYYANELVVDCGADEQSGITIVSDTTKDGMFCFADGTSGNERYRGWINYDHNVDKLDFGVAADSVFNINVDGHCKVGNPATSFENGAYASTDWGNSADNRFLNIISDGQAVLRMRGNISTDAEFSIGVGGGNFHMAYDEINGAHRLSCAASTGVVSGDLNDTSDEKLKENITSITDGQIAKIKQLRPVNFDWKNNNLKGQSGFIAQEIKTIIPNIVQGEEYVEAEFGSVGYSLNTSGLVAHLTKALQEAIGKIETLETKVATLESA
jgi:hypothetical protein